VKLIIDLRIVPKLVMSGAIPPLSHMLSWRTQGQLHRVLISHRQCVVSSGYEGRSQGVLDWNASSLKRREGAGSLSATYWWRVGIVLQNPIWFFLLKYSQACYSLLFLSFIICVGADPSGRAVCGREVAGIVGSNPTGGMDVCLL
jgi:hypothetical protein